MALHPVDTANEYLNALGFSSTEVRVYSVFDTGGECALVRGSSVGEQFVALTDLPRVVAALEPASLDGHAVHS